MGGCRFPQPRTPNSTGTADPIRTGWNPPLHPCHNQHKNITPAMSEGGFFSLFFHFFCKDVTAGPARGLSCLTQVQPDGLTGGPSQLALARGLERELRCTAGTVLAAKGPLEEFRCKALPGLGATQRDGGSPCCCRPPWRESLEAAFPLGRVVVEGGGGHSSCPALTESSVLTPKSSPPSLRELLHRPSCYFYTLWGSPRTPGGEGREDPQKGWRGGIQPLPPFPITAPSLLAGGGGGAGALQSQPPRESGRQGLLASSPEGFLGAGEGLSPPSC